jgi:SARP family transcriptional regulator, regulator of embCAB operon
VTYRILGPLEVLGDDPKATTPTAPKTAGVLAMLLLHANRLVLTETLMEEIWNGQPPLSASTTLQTYIYQIRCTLGRSSIETRPGGYVFPVDESDLDLLVFRAGVQEGQRLLKVGRPDEALGTLTASMGLWRGRPLTNVRVGRMLETDIQHLDEERRRAAELLIEAAFAAGRHRDVIGRLKLMAAEDPYNEWLHARLIEALTLTGRRREALHVYHDLRRLLAEHLGLDPMRELRELERQVLEC